jgi:hypothetical protein
MHYIVFAECKDDTQLDMVVVMVVVVFIQGIWVCLTRAFEF